MSIKLLSQVWTLGLPHSEVLVLMALADHADDDGRRVWPSVAYTAWKTGYGERAVRRILRSLQSKRIIEAVAHEKGGRSWATEYWLHLENAVKKAAFQRPSRERTRESIGVSEPQKAAISDTPVGLNGSSESNFDTVKGGPQTPPTVIEPSNEPSKESSVETPGATWLHILREIPGWETRGSPSEVTLQVWVERKGYGDDALERAAIGLAKTKTGTLKGYNRLDRAFQDRVNKGYDLGPEQVSRRPEAAPVESTPHGPIDRGDDGLWEQALELLTLQVTRPAFQTWLASSVGMGFAGKCLVVGVPSEYIREHIDASMGALLDKAVKQAGRRTDLTVAIEVLDGRVPTTVICD